MFLSEASFYTRTARRSASASAVADLQVKEDTASEADSDISDGGFHLVMENEVSDELDEVVESVEHRDNQLNQLLELESNYDLTDADLNQVHEEDDLMDQVQQALRDSHGIELDRSLSWTSELDEANSTETLTRVSHRQADKVTSVLGVDNFTRTTQDTGAGTQTLSFPRSLQGQVTRELQRLRTVEKKVPLPDFLAEHVKKTQQSFAVRLSSNFHSEVGLDVYSDWADGQTYLKLACERATLEQAARVVQNMLLDFRVRQVVFPRALATFLTDPHCPQGQEIVQGLEKSNDCTVTCRVPGKTHVLLSASTDPVAHCVKLCEGSLATSDCDTVVLPLCDGQQKWPPELATILRRGQSLVCFTFIHLNLYLHLYMYVPSSTCFTIGTVTPDSLIVHKFHWSETIMLILLDSDQ
jgi:hypothetical protein